MLRPLFFLIPLALAILFFAFRPSGPEKALVSFGGTAVVADIADTPELRARGLSGTAPLADGTGLLFVFPEPGTYGFWMRGMAYPIDIIWFDETLRVSKVEADFAPESYPAVARPDVPGSLVLEVPAGFARANDIDIGDAVTIDVRRGL